MSEPKFRTVEIQERRAEPASRRLVFPATSETPVPMRTWELGEYLEVLDHSPAAIRLDRLRSAAPLLKDHDRTAQIGVVDSVEIQDRRLVVAVRMGTSELAESEARDIAAGIRRNVSIGYLVHKLELVEKRDSGPPVYRATDWEPVEVSTVAIPADVSVGFGRSDAAQPIRTRVVREEVRSMIPEPTPAPGPSEIELRAATAAERERVEQIFAIGERYNVREEARDAVRAGTRWEAFRDQIWRRQPKDRGIDAPPTHLGMGRRGAGGRVLSQREQDRYREDFVATLRGVANTRAIERNLVTEYSEQLARETGMGFRGPLGFLIDLAEGGSERWSTQARAAALKIGETILAHGLLPDGGIAASYYPATGAVNPNVGQLRRLDVLAQVARLSALTRDPRYAAAVREALAAFEYTQLWSGSWQQIDPAFDDEFGHYGARAITSWKAVPTEPLFKSLALGGWHHFAPLWRDAVRLGGNCAADQVRCWVMLLDVAELEPKEAPQILELVRAAVRGHFKGEQSGTGAWADLTVIDYDTQTTFAKKVGDYPGAPQNLLHGLAAVYEKSAGLRTDETRALYTTVLRSSVAAYKRTHGFLIEGEVDGPNTAKGSLRLLLGIVKMYAKL